MSRIKNGAADACKARKIGFCALVLLSFLMIFVFNICTPLISDDFSYGAEVGRASSVLDLFRQEYSQYMNWNGRSVAHIMLRFFLMGPAFLFKLLNSVCFVALSLLLYANVCRKKSYDLFVYLLIQLMLWLGVVDFAQTMLWETGAANYLWMATLIFGFITLLRRKTLAFAAGRNEKQSVLLLLGCLLGGVIIGWTSENTAGGCLLFLLILFAILMLRRMDGFAERGAWAQTICSLLPEREGGKRGEKAPIPFYLAAAMIGNFAGLLIMVASPGNRGRDAMREELHSGIFGMVARVQKVTLVMGECFTVLLVLFFLTVLLGVLLHRKDSFWQHVLRMKEQLLYFFLFMAVSYALILTKQPQDRAWFGAGLFLTLGIVQGVVDNLNDEKKEDKEIVARFLWYGAAIAAIVFFFFDYVNAGAHLIRIKRDCSERAAYIEEQRDNGATQIVVAQLHPDFDNRYSAAYECEPTDDPDYWINVAMEDYFGVDEIIAIPYDEWEVYIGRVVPDEEE